MNADLEALVRRGGGLITRAEALVVVPDHVLDWAVGAGQLVRPHPEIYVDAVRADQPRLQLRAALRYAGPDAALSHVTALGVWRLPGGTLTPPVHLLVPAGRHRNGGSGLVVHRRRRFVAERPRVLIRAGLPVTRVEQTVVDSWARLDREPRRAAVIAAVADRLTTPDRLRPAIGENLNLPNRQELLRLVGLLERGCRSELELWGYDRVFTGPGLPRMEERNVAVGIGGRTVYLDVYCPGARVNFELDGAKYHASARDRERDARRDAALAAMGIMVVRFTHEQLTRSPDLVRAQVCAILAARTLP